MRKVEVKVVLNNNPSHKVLYSLNKEYSSFHKKGLSNKNQFVSSNSKLNGVTQGSFNKSNPLLLTENKSIPNKINVQPFNKLTNNHNKDDTISYVSTNPTLQKHNMNVTPSKIRVNDHNDNSKRTSYLTNNTNTFNIYCGAAPSKELKESSVKNSSKKNLQISEIDINVNDKKNDSFFRTSQNSNSQNNNSYYKDTKLELIMEALDFKEYGELFFKNKVKFEDLFILSKEDLNELKIPLGPRNRILKFIEEFRIFNNNKENYTDKQIQRFFEMKNFTNFLAHSEIITEDNLHSFGNHQRQNSSGNVTQNTFGNLQTNNENQHDNKLPIGSPNFGLFPQKTPTPYFNIQTQNEMINNKKTDQKVNNMKKSLINAYKEMNLDVGDNRNLKDLMISTKDLSPHNNEKIFKKLEKNCYKNFKELQIERKMKESQKSFHKIKRNSDKIRNSSPKCDNSSSKSFSFKTNKKKLKTIDLEMDNDSCEMTDRKSHTPRNDTSSKRDPKKGGGNLLSNYIFSKSNADLFNKSPTARTKVKTLEVNPKSPTNSGKDLMSTTFSKEAKLTNYLKANRHLLSKEFTNIEEKVGEYIKKLKDLKDKSEDRNNKINSILKKEEKKITKTTSSNNIYSKKIVARNLGDTLQKKK